jgi:RimJ/RimL family protein N-acetyltransferase
MDNSHIHLKGQLVTLELFEKSNITSTYVGWLNDRELMKYSNQRFLMHTRESCETYLASFIGTDNLFMAIFYEYQFIGTMTAYVSKNHQTVDMGLLIGAQGQTKGLGKDAWATLMQYLFSIGMRKVTGGTLRCNRAMVRIMESSGMQPDGVRVKQELVGGLPEDIVYFARFSH